MRYDVIVVGGGVVGLSTAWALLRFGLGRVAVLERKLPGAGASGLGAGSISLHRWQPGDIAFVRRSLELMSALQKASSGLFRVQSPGRLTLAKPGAQSAALGELAEIVRSAGEQAESLTPEAAADRFPSINFADAGSVLYSPDDAVTHPPQLVAALAGAARSAGVHILEGSEVVGLNTKDGRISGVRLLGGWSIDCDEVVLATNAWSRKLLQSIELDVPLKPYRTQAAFMLLPGVTTQPVVYDAIQGMYTVPRNPASTLAGDGTHAHHGDPGQFDPVPDQDFYVSIIERFRHRFPVFGPVMATGGWAGILDMTPDGRPLMGDYGRVHGLYLNAGFAGFGIMRALAAGEALAAHITGRTPLVDLTPYRADRYSGWQEFELNFGRPYDPLGDH